MKRLPFLLVVLLAAHAEAREPAPTQVPAGCAVKKLRHVTPDPDPRIAHVTHAWPHCSPCVKLQPKPAFLLRLDRVVEPSAVLAAIDIVGGPSHEWRKLEWTLKACVVETNPAGPSAMTLIFQPAAPRPPGTYDWLVRDSVAKALHWGVSTTNLQAGGIFVVGEPVGQRHPDAPIAAQLAAPREPAEVFSHLRNARESFAMVREWGDLSIPRAADAELAAREAEFRKLRGDAGQPLPLFDPGR